MDHMLCPSDSAAVACACVCVRGGVRLGDAWRLTLGRSRPAVTPKQYSKPTRGGGKGGDPIDNLKFTVNKDFSSNLWRGLLFFIMTISGWMSLLAAPRQADDCEMMGL